MTGKKKAESQEPHAFALMPEDNNAFYIGENAPEGIYCPKCGCILDESYRPATIDVNANQDFSYTLDGRIILSEKARSFLDAQHIDGLEIRPLASRKRTVYLLDTNKIVKFDTTRRPVVFESMCPTCGQYLDVYHALPVYLEQPKEIQAMTLAKTDLISGYKDRKSPIFIVGAKLMKELKSSRLSGLAFDPVHD